MQPVPKIFLSASIGLLLLLCSCSTYNERIQKYYSRVAESNFKEADKELDKNKLIKAGRNKLLYYLEKGRVAHALASYDTSNYYFNQADRFIEQNSTANAGDVIAGTLINPMMQRYRGEDFEKLMIHYYKALNYIYLNQPEEAVVEARRISLQNLQLQDKVPNQERQYTQDAFSQNLQGLIYESTGDINNAFIAYRNAAELYLKNENQEYYGVKLPVQLQNDVLRSAYLNGFNDELDKFEVLFNRKYKPDAPSEGGYLILFWENGMAPVKEQEDFFFSLTKGAEGLFFVNGATNERIPFDSSVGFTSDNLDVSNLDNFHIAFPKFVYRKNAFQSATVADTLASINVEEAEDVTAIAEAIQKQRFMKEMSLALSRLAVKKAAQYIVKGGNSDSKKNKELREGLASLMDVYSLFLEKADTRNWQSLPSEIHYARLPLKKGVNDVTIKLTGTNGAEEVRKVKIEGSGGIKFYNYASLK